METIKGLISSNVFKAAPGSVSKLLLLLFYFSFNANLKAQLIINEVSQGASGNKEYVELLVVGTSTCTTIPCMDLRGYYIDDNNGNHAAGAGTGIAQGCVRFTTDPLWSCVPVGTLIVIYNDADLNASIPAQDLSLTDGNCVLVIPVSNCTLLEKHTTQPSTGTSVYPTTGFVPCGSWTNISMANTDDSFQTIDPSGNLVFSVSWGNNTVADIIYFAGSQTGMVTYMTNATNNNPATQTNWIKAAVAGNETPGAPNNAANAAWINSMNNSCGTILPLTLSFTTTPTACACTGSATVIPSGAVGPYTYTWSPGAITTDTIGSLCLGNYSVSISSANGCLVSDTVSIYSSVILTPTITFTNVSCNGFSDGTANVNVTGSAGPFTYTWSPTGGNSSTATNLPIGNYTVDITDAGGCTTSATVAISQPPVLTASITSTDITCFGANNGTANVNATGGTGTYTYSWLPAGGANSSASNLAQGNYTVTVTDASGCTTSASTLISEPTQISFTVTTTSATCNGTANGTASVTAGGGTGAFTYTWSPIGGNSSGATNLPAGNYSVNVTDANGCLATSTLTITQPNSITTTVTSTSALCFGGNGSATLTAQGGTGAYTYSWSPTGGTNSTANMPAGNYTVTVSDINNCQASATVTVAQPGVLTASITSTDITCFGANNGTANINASGGTGAYTYSWSPTGGSNSSATNLSQGNYTVTITDANGCTTSASTLISEPSQVSLTVISTSVTCNGFSNGTTSATATGGTGVFTYTWSPVGGNSSAATNLPAGNYSVDVTDANGCPASASVTVNQASAITVTLTVTNASCGVNNGSIIAAAIGGTGAYTYTWSPTGGNSNSASALGPGTYTVLVTDANNCSVSTNTTVTQPQTFTLSVASTSVTCNGKNDGSATVNIIGGTAPFTYQWSPTGGTNAATGNILTAGNYTVLVTDASPCAGSATVTITQPTPVSVSANGQSICSGQTAVITANASGGNGAPYTYSWSSGGTGSTQTVTPNSNSTYTVVAIDSKGCLSLPDTAMVNVLSPLTIIVVSNDTTCAGQPATLSATANGGNGNYTITWMPGNLTGSSISVNPTSTTVYTATVTDGCTANPASASGQVTVLQNPLINFNPNPASGCAPVCVNFAAVAGNVNGNNIVSYAWYFGDGGTSSGLNAYHCYANSGSFSVYLLGITQKGCRDSILKNSLITVFPQPKADFTASTFTADIYDPTINFYDQSQGTVTGWHWNFSVGTSTAHNPSYTFPAEGTYPVTLVVSNAQGCKDSVTKEIIIKPVFTFYAPNAFTPNSDGTNETFFPKGTAWDPATYNLWVFDRWGNQLYHGTDPAKGWDGTKHGEALMQDVYVWKVELRDTFGTPHEYNGIVSIVRN